MNKKEKEIKELVSRLDEIFNPLNKEVCATCKINCCKECSKTMAFLPFNKSDFFLELKERYGFNKRKGFILKDGCRLPREFRSFVCISFMCFKLKGFDHIEAYRISNRLYDLRGY